MEIILWLQLYAETRTCGSLSLCAPTVIALARNDDADYKTFSTGSASERRNDFEQVRSQEFQTRIFRGSETS